MALRKTWTQSVLVRAFRQQQPVTKLHSFPRLSLKHAQSSLQNGVTVGLTWFAWAKRMKCSVLSKRIGNPRTCCSQYLIPNGNSIQISPKIRGINSRKEARFSMNSGG